MHTENGNGSINSTIGYLRASMSPRATCTEIKKVGKENRSESYSVECLLLTLDTQTKLYFDHPPSLIKILFVLFKHLFTVDCPLQIDKCI